MRKRATLKDVAQAAGVHPGTVSRVLHPTTRELVNAETAARIDEITADDRPDFAPRARAMRRRLAACGARYRQLRR
jgi:LacI family transcriptional regulator